MRRLLTDSRNCLDAILEDVVVVRVLLGVCETEIEVAVLIDEDEFECECLG